jgi:hypothetical protein
MSERHYQSANRIGRVVQFSFPQGDKPLGITIPVEDITSLMADCANIIRDHYQLPPSEPLRIERAILEGLDSETRLIKAVAGIQTAPHPDATQPTILRIIVGTETGPMVLRISQIAAVELTSELSKNPLTRGSA